ncbi:MAG: hypothetical protein ACK2UK_12630 [Candidatus Promineifilaceae bacterium]
MSNKFEWRTEEEAWAEMDARDDAAQTAVPAVWSARLRSPRFWLPAALLIVLPLALAASWVMQRSRETQAQITADLMATENLLLDAALNGDTEQLALALSESDFQWHQLQRLYLRHDLLLDRGPFQFWLDEEALRASLVQGIQEPVVHLSPDLAAAELEIALPYVTESAGGERQPLTLVQRLNLAYEGQRWRLVPPPAGSWGETERSDGRYVSATFPARDGDLSRAIAAAVDERYAALCGVEEAVSCPPRAHIEITFDSDPASLRALARPVQGNRFWIFGERLAAGERFQIDVPAPSLVGLPAGPVEEQALIDGYASWLLTAYMARKQPQIPFEQIAARLDGLGLRLPPPPGYRPPPPRDLAALPQADLTLSCIADGRLTGQWRYQPASAQWGPCTACATTLDALAGDGAAGGLMRFERYNEATGRLLPPGGAGLETDGTVLVRPFLVGFNTVVFLTGTPITMGRVSAAGDERIVIAYLHDMGRGYEVTIMREIGAEALRPAIPGDRHVGRLRLDAALADPAVEGGILVLAGNGTHEQFLFRVVNDTQAVELVANWVDNGSNFREAQVAENGRFLTVLRYGTRSSYLTLIDLADGRRRIFDLEEWPLARYAWTADGRWLAIADDRLLRLLAPAEGLEVTVQHAHEGCTAVAWEEMGNS